MENHNNDQTDFNSSITNQTILFASLSGYLVFLEAWLLKYMKIPYIILALCLFVYADNFKGITIVELDQPSVNLGRADKESGEYYINAIKETCNTEIVQYFHKANIIKFFKQAKEYDNIPVAQYCTYPCVITGKVKLDSITYDFELNEGGYAVLKGKNEERYFGDEKLYGECGI